MKKTILALGLVALATVVSCQKEDPKPTSGLDFITEQVIDVADANFATIEFNAYEAWTAEVVDADGEPVSDVILSAKSGVAGDAQKLKVTLPSLAEGETGRVVGVEFKYGNDVEIVFVIQGKAILIDAIDSEDGNIPAEAGDYTFAIISNCKFNTSADSDASWFTAQVEQSVESKMAYTLTATVEANDDYTLRHAWVKFTTSDIQVAVLDDNGTPTGETKDYETSLDIYQAGLATLAFSKSLAEYGVTTLSAAGAIHRLGTKDDKIVISDGTAFHVLDGDGAYVSGSASPVQDVLPEAMAVDAAGNMIFAAAGAYCGTFDIYLATDAADPAKFISYEHNSVYSNMVSNLRVYGDVTGDAVITAHTDLYPYCVYWEVKAGVPGEAKLVELPSGANWDTWSGIIWNANRNGCVAPLGTTADAGFLFIAYDAQYTLFFVDKDGNAQALFAYEEYFGEGAGSNVNFQSISVREWNGKIYAAVGISTYFSWGGCPDVILLDVTDQEIVANFDHWNYDITCNYVGANDGENASADVCLIPEDDQLGIVMIDGLNDVIYRINCPKK